MAGRRRLLFALCVLAAGNSLQAQHNVTLREGTKVRLSANADGSRLSFDLAGLIWTINPADGTTRSLTQPELLARRPALSPDGHRIVFDARVAGRRHLWVIDAGGGAPERLTFGDYDHHSAVWHPDGQRIAFVSNRNNNAGIWELELATLALRQRTFEPGDERDAAWSSTGDRLVYVGAAGDDDALFIVGEDGRPQRVIRSADRIHAPSWRPDDSLLTFVHRGPGVSELRVAILSEPPVVRRLTRGENLLTTPALWLNSAEFIYMADGRIRRRRFDDFDGVDINFQARLSLTTTPVLPTARFPLSSAPAPVRGITGIARSGERLFVSALGNLWELDASGNAAQMLTTAPFLDTQLTGSPDGTQLAFVSDRGNGFQVWLLNVVDGTRQELTAEPGGAFYPAWRPDGGAIAYLAATRPDARNLTLKGVHLESGKVVELARGLPDIARPRWRADGQLTVKLGEGGQLIFNSDSDTALETKPVPGDVLESPNGRHVARLDQGRLSVAHLDSNAPQDGRLLADAGASQPQWIDNGRTLAWLTPSGPMIWTAEDDLTAKLPVSLTWQPTGATAERRLVVRAGKVFDGLGPGYLYAQDILIVGNRIEAIGPWRDPPPGELLDARDLTVLPGLMDLAVEPRHPVGEQTGRAWLAWGVTSVREFVRDPTATRERQESWASGQRPGPRVFAVISVCGNEQLQQAPAWPGTVGVAVCRTQDGPAQAAAIGRAGELGLGAIAADPFPGALLGAGEIPLQGRHEAVAGYPGATHRFVYGDVIDIAGAAGLTSVSKLSAIGLPALLLNDDSLLGDERVAALIRPAALTWYQQNWQAQLRSLSTNLRAEARTAGQSLFRAVSRSARVVVGSGAPAVPPGLGVHAELRLLGQTGLQPFQVLRMATLDAAGAIGAGDVLGSVKAGALADLVLVRGDPLAAIEDAANVELTVIDGRVYRGPQLRSVSGVGNFYSP